MATRKLDITNGNTAWEDLLKSEMKDLFNLECFDIKSIGYFPGGDYQGITLTIIYDVKQDLRQKARLVAGGHLIDPLDHSVYSSTVKGISVKLLYAIAQKADLHVAIFLCVFVNAFTCVLLNAIAGPKFVEHESSYKKLFTDCAQVPNDGTHILPINFRAWISCQ
jgi:hypothetical protein